MHTQVYDFKNQQGYVPVINKENSSMSLEGFGIIELKAGQELSYTVENEEQAAVLINGDISVRVEWKGEKVIDCNASRGNVYDDLPTAFYFPPACTVYVKAQTDSQLRYFSAYLEEEGNDPFVCTPDLVVEAEPGEGMYKRKYREIFGAAGKANSQVTKRLLVGESVSVPGGWIGFPAHRHDYFTDVEGIMDEIFSYKMRAQKGGGVIVDAFDLDEDFNKLWNEFHLIENDDSAVALPVGFHCCVAMPGTEVYLLWGLAGESKVYRVQFDERYTWLQGWQYGV